MRILLVPALLAAASMAAQKPAAAPEQGTRRPAAAAQSSPGKQETAPKAEKEPPPRSPEEEHFNKIMSEAGSSPVDYARALEEHLRLFPDTARRPAIERSIVQTAMEMKDRRRIILYGERVVRREPNNLKVLERLTRALLDSDDAESAKKALRYAQQYQSALKMLEMTQPPAGPAIARMRQQLDTALGKALVYQARAEGNLGHLEKAVELARQSYETNPSSEAAREIGRWLAKLNRDEEAIRCYADAFVIFDSASTSRLRAGDRKRLKELYLKTHESEAGLGDLILEAYDRTAGLLRARHEALKKLDPNLDVTDPMEITLTGLNGEKLPLSSLRGKVIVLDFWATWCQPCRIQQSLYEEVKEKYRDNPDVVFLAINTDEDHAIVKPFLEQEQWDMNVYFENGLQRLLQVSSIPTTVILDRHGQVASHMMGFIPERFADMLTERIERTLADQ